EEQQQLLQLWNNTAYKFPSTLLVHQLFEQQVALRPDAPALLFEEQTLTFSEINSRANQLARYLLCCGLEPEARVGVMLPRTPDVLVALLAIFKAGGCYLPLDPEYPIERLAFVLEDAAVSLLITEESLRVNLPEQAPRVITLDAEQLAELS